jgi:hypothetical protein
LVIVSASYYPPVLFTEEVPMPTALGNNKQTHQVRQELGWLGLAALATVLVLATAALVGAVF